jgi:hypothetical protein
MDPRNQSIARAFGLLEVRASNNAPVLLRVV